MGKRSEEREHFDHYEKLIRERIDSLRKEEGISETALSESLGNSRSYINNITSGKSLPSMIEFLKICDYYDITPAEFFDEGNKHPLEIKELMLDAYQLDKHDLTIVLNMARRLCEYAKKFK